MKLYCASTNRGKLREFRLAVVRLGQQQFEVDPAPGLEDMEPCEETGMSFEENAVQKAVYYSRSAPGLLFADDSGIEVRALGGAPGVNSARYSGPGATDESNNRLVLEKLYCVDDRAAQFVCVIALAQQGRLVATFRGVVEGAILHEPRGAGGFGYDPLFFYPPLGCAFAEIPAEAKLTVSHRGRALTKMLEYLERLKASVSGGVELPEKS